MIQWCIFNYPKVYLSSWLRREPSQIELAYVLPNAWNKSQITGSQILTSNLKDLTCMQRKLEINRAEQQKIYN